MRKSKQANLNYMCSLCQHITETRAGICYHFNTKHPDKPVTFRPTSSLPTSKRSGPRGPYNSKVTAKQAKEAVKRLANARPVQVDATTSELVIPVLLRIPIKMGDILLQLNQEG